MTFDPRAVLWGQFILAAALARRVTAVLAAEPDDLAVFSYTDTHAGTGRLSGPLDGCDALQAARERFRARAWFHGIPADQAPCDHPGSWVLAGRILAALGGRRLAVEMDVNDLSPQAMEQGKAHREGGWVRLWSHDWFLFLRARLGRPERPDFVFVDPPLDDPRGPAYAIDAAILMDALGVPYMVSYPVEADAVAQAAIDQIGRTGLELLDAAGRGWGVMLGGGAETVLLDIITDLGVAAEILGGRFHARLPASTDGDAYCI